MWKFWYSLYLPESSLFLKCEGRAVLRKVKARCLFFLLARSEENCWFTFVSARPPSFTAVSMACLVSELPVSDKTLSPLVLAMAWLTEISKLCQKQHCPSLWGMFLCWYKTLFSILCFSEILVISLLNPAEFGFSASMTRIAVKISPKMAPKIAVQMSLKVYPFSYLASLVSIKDRAPSRCSQNQAEL